MREFPLPLVLLGGAPEDIVEEESQGTADRLPPAPAHSLPRLTPAAVVVNAYFYLIILGTFMVFQF